MAEGQNTQGWSSNSSPLSGEQDLPSGLRSTLEAHCWGIQYGFAFIQEGNLAHRWPVLSFVSHKQTFELSIYITVW